MGRPKKDRDEETTEETLLEKSKDNSFDFMNELNKSAGEKLFYSLDEEELDGNVENWIPTGCTYLDYIISNKRNGGIPEGRITEIYAMPSLGKSLLGYQILRSAQKMGRAAILYDTEYATQKDYLVGLGLKPNLMFSPEKNIEKIFTQIDQTISMASAKNKPAVIIIDSVAAAATTAELEKGYDQLTVGELARALSRGLKKLTEVIGKNKITLVLLNQVRTKINTGYVAPGAETEDSCGGNAPKFYASVRIKLSGGGVIYEDPNKKDLGIVGNHIIATTVKNKVAPPKRKCEFDIIYGVGSMDGEYLFDALRQKGSVICEDKKIIIEGTGAWKTFSIADIKTGEIDEEVKFYKQDFASKILNEAKYKKYTDVFLDEVLIKPTSTNGLKKVE